MTINGDGDEDDDSDDADHTRKVGVVFGEDHDGNDSKQSEHVNAYDDGCWFGRCIFLNLALRLQRNCYDGDGNDNGGSDGDDSDNDKGGEVDDSDSDDDGNGVIGTGDMT